MVVEEGQPVIEEQLRGIMPGNAVVKGRLSGELPAHRRLTPDAVKKASDWSCPSSTRPAKTSCRAHHSCSTAAATATPIRP
jgi:indolepyruvate ferredoxin oxidoreductase alpha subunit